MTKNWDETYSRLQLEFQAVVPAWLDDTAAELESLRESPDPEITLASVFRRLHDLSGTCGMYGMGAASSLANEATILTRHALERDSLLTCDELSRLRVLIDAIRGTLPVGGG